MTTSDQGSVSGSMTALQRLVEEGVIVRFAADFSGGSLVATVTITAQDELSVARARRAVKQALEPTFPNARVVIKPAEGVPVQGVG